jgi:sterol desaturase/sphingolipid hydroxylase (fatty acid hydroxylase superfamily)
MQVSWKKYKKALKLIALNVFVVGPLYNVVVYPLTVWRGNECGYELPSFLVTVWHLFCYIVVEEIGFYYFHRYTLIKLCVLGRKVLEGGECRG